MNTNSVAYCYDQMQQDVSPRIGEVVLFRGTQVYCPMCEMWHENNTLCQQGSY